MPDTAHDQKDPKIAMSQNGSFVITWTDSDSDAPGSRMIWGDGFEIDTVIHCRMAAAKVRIAEVPSIELRRIFGESNLRTLADGTRVLRTILAERKRARALTRSRARNAATREWPSSRPDLDVVFTGTHGLEETA